MVNLSAQLLGNVAGRDRPKETVLLANFRLEYEFGILHRIGELFQLSLDARLLPLSHDFRLLSLLHCPLRRRNGKTTGNKEVTSVAISDVFDLTTSSHVRDVFRQQNFQRMLLQ